LQKLGGGLAAGVNVMLNPMTWCWFHIPGSQNGRIFCPKAQNLEIVAVAGGQKLAKQGWVLDGLVSIKLKLENFT
jgi:hypothetical protein